MLELTSSWRSNVSDRYSPSQTTIGADFGWALVCCEIVCSVVPQPLLGRAAARVESETRDVQTSTQSRTTGTRINIAKLGAGMSTWNRNCVVCEESVALACRSSQDTIPSPISPF